MAWVAIAIGGSALIGGVATYFGSQAASSASQQAVSVGSATQRQAINTEWKMYKRSRKDYLAERDWTREQTAPWREAGQRAVPMLEEAAGKYQEEITAGPGEFIPEEQPGYEFGFEHFIEDPYLSVQSARGKRLSGETIKGLTGYAQDYAETSYDNFLNRYYTKLNAQLTGMQPYQSLAQLGMGAGSTPVGGMTGATMQAGQSIAGLQSNIGQLQYQNALNQGAIQSQATAAYGGIAQQGINSYMNYMMLNKIGAGTGGSVGGGTITGGTGQGLTGRYSY